MLSSPVGELPQQGRTLELTTEKVTPLLKSELTSPTRAPVVAPTGTITVMLVLAQAVAEAETPSKVTVLTPWVAPKFTPVIVVAVPAGPEFSLKLPMEGPGVKSKPLLATPETVTSTLPGVDPNGTVAVMLALAQVTTAAEIP